MIFFTYIFFLLPAIPFSQSYFHNNGNIQIHDEGQIGFHTNLINEGLFNQNLELENFYHETELLTILGSEASRIFDLGEAVVYHSFQKNISVVNRGLSYLVHDVFLLNRTSSISLNYFTNVFEYVVDNKKNTDDYASISKDLKTVADVCKVNYSEIPLSKSHYTNIAFNNINLSKYKINSFKLEYSYENG